MPSDVEVPDTCGEKIEKWAESGIVVPNQNDPIWYDQATNEKERKEFSYSSPWDARFPQCRQQNKCFTYYVDFFRCKELMGEDYKPCKFFANVYKTYCPSEWVEKWDEWRDEGRFPARFDR